MHKRLGHMLLFLMFILSGCEEKAMPVDETVKDTPTQTPEKAIERGYIETH